MMTNLPQVARILIIGTLVLAGFVLASCSEDACTLNCNGDLRYPLQVGYSWQYSGEERISNFRPDSDTVTEVPSDTVRKWDLTITVSGTDTLDDGTVVYILHEVQSSGDSLIAESYQYYGNKSDGLYHYNNLSIGYSLLLFKSTLVAIGGSPRADFARKSLEYPLREGLQWEYTNGFDYGPAGAIYKRVIGIGEQTVPAGKFECYAIDWIWENLPKTEQTEYIADDGLIRTRMFTRDVLYTSNSQLEGIGLVDITTELQLTRSPF